MDQKIFKFRRNKISLINGDIEVELLMQAATNVNRKLTAALNGINGVDLDLYEIIDLRMLSGLMGEMFTNEISKLDCRLIKNPNIDGYPDLCDISRNGQAEAVKYFSLNDFIAYCDGGLEVKNTFGLKKANTHIIARESRISNIQNKLVWKAHHRQTNNLLAIHSDYVKRIPQIIAVFYSDQLTTDDWTVKQQPKVGSTMTSFCQTTPNAFLKLKQGLQFYMDDIQYEQFIGTAI